MKPSVAVLRVGLGSIGGHVADDPERAGQGSVGQRPADDSEGHDPEREPDPSPEPAGDPDPEPAPPGPRHDERARHDDPGDGRQVDEEHLGVGEVDERAGCGRGEREPTRPLDDRPVDEPQPEQGEVERERLGLVGEVLELEPDGREQQDRPEQGEPAADPAPEQEGGEDQPDDEQGQPVELELDEQVAGQELERRRGVGRDRQVVGLERPLGAPLREGRREVAADGDDLGEVGVVPDGRGERQERLADRRAARGSRPAPRRGRPRLRPRATTGRHVASAAGTRGSSVAAANSARRADDDEHGDRRRRPTRMPSQASTVQPIDVVSRLAPTARPIRPSGVEAPGARIGPRASPGTTKMTASATTAWSAAAERATGSMNGRANLDTGR